jgi:peptidoglycan/xylan/chitin deacetylase (PgdA/CDA1 family)
MAARVATHMGAHRLLRGRTSASLLVLNYHRIRRTRDAQTAFDDGVFDTDLDTFRRQMEWLKSETVVLDESALLDVVTNGADHDGTVYSAVTFDDGYSDCYELVRPVLDQLGLRGIFFIPVEMIEMRRLGWWDLAANILKRTQRECVSVQGRTYDLANDFNGALRSVLQRFKLEPVEQTASLLDRLAAACDVPLATEQEQSRQLMTWRQIHALHVAGHAIGAHSMTHRVLATLDAKAQAVEIRDSGRRLEEVLGCQIRSFAYPVGGLEHINGHSVRLVREAGYAQAFTFNTGVSDLPVIDRFRVPRESARSVKLLMAKTLWPSLMGLRREVQRTR